MKLVLHIGTEKTGTTTIQRALAKNSRTLREHHIFYDPSLFHVWFLGLPNTSMGFIVHQKIVSKILRDAAAERVFETAVASSELMQSRLPTNQQVSALKSQLDNLGLFSQYLIIVYFRRPASIANSMASTAVQFDRKEEQSLYSEYLDIICNHQSTVERWSSVFGKSSVIPRILERRLMYHGDLTSDFINILDPGVVPFISKQAPLNTQISADAIEIMDAVNIHLRMLAKNKQVDCERVRSARERIYSKLETFMNSPKYIMAAKHWLAYDSKYRDSDEWIRSHFFPTEESLWSYEIPETCHESALPISLARQIAQILCSYEVK